MPAHVHVVITPTASLEQTAAIIKGGTSFILRKAYKGPIWQQGYYSHRIRSAEDFAGQVTYIARNHERKGWRTYLYVHTRYLEHLDPMPDHLCG